MINTTTRDLEALKARIEQLTARLAESDPSISVESIDVQGNVTGNIVVGNRNVIGDNNIIYEIHTAHGTFIQPHELRPSIRKRPPGAPPHLPRRFVGRERELKLLEEQIRSKVPVLLYGQSGVGKTTLLQKVAHGEVAKSMPDGVIYLEQLYDGSKLSFQDLLQRLFDRMFESDPRLKLTHPLHQSDPTQNSFLLDLLKQLFPRWFGARSGTSFDDSLIEANLTTTAPLILLDEMELGQDALNRLSRLFPRGSVLATAPNAPIDDVYESIPVAPLGREEAIRLFAEKSGVDPDATLYPFMDQICEILEDVPLAITNVANFSRYTNDIHGTLKILGSQLADIQPSTQDRIQAAIERSLGLLDVWLNSLDREMLYRVAAAPGKSVDRDGLEASREEAEQTVRKLERMELLYANSPRMRLPEGLRGLIQSHLKDLDGLRAGQAQHLIDELARDNNYLRSNFVTGELGNILGLLEWAFRERRWWDVLELGKAIDPYLTLQGLWDVWGTVLKQVEVAARNEGNAAARAWALHQLGTREIGVGSRRKAIDLLKRALELRLHIGDVRGAAYTLHNLRILLLLWPGGDEGHDDDDDNNNDDNNNGNNGKRTPKPDPTLMEALGVFLSDQLWPLLRRYAAVLAGTAVMLVLLAGILMQPSLRFVPQAAQERYSPDDQAIEYRYVVDNAGLVPIPGPIVVTDEKVQVRCPDLRDIGDGDNSLDWNERITCTGFYLITEEDIKKGSVSSNPSISTTGKNGKAGLQSKPRTLVIPLETNTLAVSVEAQPKTFGQAGQTITIAYILKNNGTADLNGPIQIHTDDKLSVSCPELARSGDPDILGAGEARTCTALYTVTDADVKSGSITTTVRASAGRTDSDSQTITIYGIPPRPGLLESGLSLSASTDQTVYKAAGEQIRFTYSITNQGTNPLRGPVSLTADGVSVACSSLAEVGNRDNLLNPQERVTCLGIHVIDQTDIERRSLTTHVSATAGNTTTEPQSITIFFEAPPPVLFKSADRQTYRAAGEKITYTYVVMNQGSAPAAGPVLVKDDMLDVKCPQIDQGVAPGQSVTCTAAYTITEADVRNSSVTNTAVAYLGENTSEPQSVTVSFQVVPSNLTLSKRAKPETYNAVGQTIEYTYFVANEGQFPLKGPVVITDDQAGVTCPEINTIGDGDGALDPGERMICSAVYTITDLDLQMGAVTNSARASMDGVDSNPAAVTVTESALNLVITTDRQTYEAAGDMIQYEYVITGKSKEPLHGPLTITRENDTLKIDCPAISTIGNGDNFLDWNETITCTVPYAVTQEDIDIAQPGSDHGLVTNSALASMGGIDSAKGIVEVRGPVQQRGLALAVTADTTRFDSVDQKITYTYVVTNTGNVTISAPIPISDDHINGGAPFACGAENQRMAPNETVTCTGVYTVKQDDFGPKSVTNTATIALPDPGLLTITSPSATTTVTCQTVDGWVPYIVEPNESLDHITSWYTDKTQADLQKANCMGSSNSVATGQTIYVPLQPPSATISGFLSDTTGQPLRNTPVVLTNDEDGSTRTIYTGASGEYTFSDLGPGTYRIFQIVITIRRGETKAQNFTIVPGAP